MNEERPSPRDIAVFQRRERRRASAAKTRQALGELVLARIASGFWHTTSPDRFRAILESVAIMPEPNLPDSEPWSTNLGPEWYPYVRTLGGVSLFDFHDFEPESYRGRFPMSSWYAFVPYRDQWKASVWIEIDCSLLGSNVISGKGLLARWKAAKIGNRIMPEIEAAHIGPIPTTAFISAFIARHGTSELEPVDCSAAARAS